MVWRWGHVPSLGLGSKPLPKCRATQRTTVGAEGRAEAGQLSTAVSTTCGYHKALGITLSLAQWVLHL